MTLSLSLTEAFVVIGILTVVLRFILTPWIPKGLRLPPGPPGVFLIGNIRDVPSHREWETYSEWHRKYGDLVYLNVLGTSLLYVNSAEMAVEIFDKRSAIYSDRPVIPMLDLIGLSWALSLMPYGERWRQHRHTLHQKFERMIAEYTPIQVKHSRNLLRLINDDPDDWESLIRHSVTAIIMEISYGIEILRENDPYVARAEFTLDIASRTGTPGAYLVNTIPLLRHLPEWFPGAGFLRKAKVWKKTVVDVPTVPCQFVKKTLAAGNAKPSLTATLLEEAYANAPDQRISEDEEELIRNVAGIVYIAGSDTTSSTLSIFVFAMVLYPEAQSAAQKELDAVIGPNRLPSFEDRNNLPYLNALCKEVLRWHPLLTTAVPHRLIQDNVIGEYFIPAGTIVFGNAWGMLHSESVYGPDTMAFKPERFLHSPDKTDPAAAFGFGRRACPGRDMAEQSLFIVITSLLHVFNIVLPPGASPPDSNAFVPGALSRPLPFKCTFIPRSEAAKALIAQAE